MADALRQLLAEFVVEVDKAGALKRGNAEVEALKDRLHELQTVLNTIKVPAQRAAKTVQDVFARAAQQAQANLAAIEAKSLGGRASSDGFFAAGRAAALRDQAKAAEQAANSFGTRLRAGFVRASAAAGAFSARLSSGASSVMGGLTSLRAGVAGLAIGAGARFAKGFIDQIGGIGEAAAKLGVTTDEFQRLDVLAKQNATSVEALGTAFRNLGRVAGDPTKDSAAAFGALGVNTKDGNGALKSRQDLFFETAGALADVGNETKRAQLATQLFGRSGTELLPMLANGRAGLEAQRAELMKLAVVSDEAIRQADEFGDRWGVTTAGLRTKLTPVLLKLMPLFEGVADFAGKVLTIVGRGATALSTWASNSRNAGTGADTLKKALDALLFPLKVIEDFFVFMAGGDSVLGRRLDAMFGTDGQGQVRAFAEGALGLALLNIQAIVTAVDQLIKLFTASDFDAWAQGFLDATDDMGAALDRFFAKLNTIGQAVSQIPGLGFLGSALSAPAAIGETAGAVGTASGQGLFGAVGQGLVDGLMAPTIANPGLPAAAGFAGGAPIDQRTQSVTVNVGSTAEVAGAVAGAQRGMGRDAAANLAAVQ